MATGDGSFRQEADIRLPESGAVDADVLPGDPSAAVAGKKRDDFGELPRFAEPLERRSLPGGLLGASDARPRYRSVSVAPGDTQLQVIPRFPHSLDAARVNCSSALHTSAKNGVMA